MRCSCKVCGTYMVQIERGLFSGCKCPECSNMCRDCMGSVDAPMNSEQLRAKFNGSSFEGGTAQPSELPEWVERQSEWQKML